jgi:hypothetical protein
MLNLTLSPASSANKAFNNVPWHLNSAVCYQMEYIPLKVCFCLLSDFRLNFLSTVTVKTISNIFAFDRLSMFDFELETTSQGSK